MLAAFVVACLISIVLGLGLRAVYAPEWLQLDTTQHPPALRAWCVEADCYSQLARDQRILQGQGLVQNHFTVENWPEGLTPSTTAPFDYAILLLYAPLALLTKFPLDWAGALISPLLWMGLVLFWIFFRSREFTLMGRALFVVISAAMPAIVWATAFGRPRHQSLILFLMAVALTAEYERWHIELVKKRAWHILAGVAWALACWTSLFEPAFVWSVLVIFNLVVRRRESLAFLISFGGVMLLALAVEGLHIFVPPPEYHAVLLRWLGTIAEVRGIGLSEFLSQVLWLTFVLLVPFISWRLLGRKGDRRADLLLIVLTVLLAVLAVVQRRWTYYANLTELFLIVRYCQVAPLRWTRILVMAIVLFGLVYDNILQLEMRLSVGANQPSVELAQISKSINEPGGIMAPWWLSPGLLYFSGQPIVSGSSHCGISGIVDSSKFYTASSWVDAEQLLKKRQVRWVVVYDNPAIYYPVLNASRGLLGLPSFTDDNKDEAEQTVAQILINDRYVPTFLRLRAVTPNLKLYEYLPAAH